MLCKWKEGEVGFVYVVRHGNQLSRGEKVHIISPRG